MSNSHDKDMADLVFNTLKRRLEKHALGKTPIDPVSDSTTFPQKAGENVETVFVSGEKVDVAKSREAQQRFLELLSEGLTVSEACLRAGVSRASLYRLRASSLEFKGRWDGAEEMAAERFEVEADRRGMTGWEETIYYKGSAVGVRRRYSDRMLMFRLRALKPRRYARVRG